MGVFDLTHTIRPDMPVFPGTPAPVLQPAASLETAGFRETSLTLTSHTGTHMDAPAHLLPHGATLDAYPMDRLIGRGFLLDCRGRAIEPPLLAEIPPEQARDAFLLLHTGWWKNWDSQAYFQDAPYLPPTTASAIVGLGFRGVGIDGPSVDPVSSASLPSHHILLAAGLLILENLTRLDQLSAAPFTLFALPLPFLHGDGAPARVIAVQ